MLSADLIDLRGAAFSQILTALVTSLEILDISWVGKVQAYDLKSWYRLVIDKTFEEGSYLPPRDYDSSSEGIVFS